MGKALKGLFASKKFWLAVIGSAIVTILAAVLPLLGLGEILSTQIIQYVAGFFGVSLAGIGLADFGKEAKK